MEKQIAGSESLPSKKKNTWFAKIETREDALSVIKDTSNNFYFLALIQTIFGYLIAGPLAIVDGIIFVFLGFLLRKYNSRFVSAIMIVISLFIISSTSANIISGAGGTNMWLAVAMLWISIRAWQATSKLRKLSRIEPQVPTAI